MSTRMPRWRTCGSSNTWRRSFTAAHGTPAAVSGSIHAASVRPATMAATIGTSSSRFRTRSGLVANRGIGDQLLAPGDAAKRGELAIVPDGEHHRAVARGEHLVRHDVLVRVAMAVRHVTRAPVVEDLIRAERHGAVEQAEIDVLAPRPSDRGDGSAASTATVAYMPPITSVTAMPTFCGPPPGMSSRSPVMLMMPLIAWNTKS
jgi:hypothetical protein